MTGREFGRLTVIKRAEDQISPSGRRRVTWLCQCECGNRTIVLGDNLKKGVSQSCGCLRTEVLHDLRVTHGETDTKLYGVWLAMRRRCDLPTSTYYRHYGGRGIQVCDEWRQSFETFRDWANAHGYAEGLSIDRIDNNKGYNPENCRWVDCVVQANNRRSNRLLTWNGETHNLTQWARIRGINPHTLHTRLDAG